MAVPMHSDPARTVLLRSALIIAAKDLRTEVRRVYELVSVLTFAAGAMVIAGLVLQDRGENIPAVILWITLFFVTVLIFTTSFTREADRGTIGGLKTLPCSPLAILAGKILSGTILVEFTALVLISFSLLLFSQPGSPDLPGILVVVVLGALGLSFAGSFVSGLVMCSEEKTMLLSFLLLPVSVPVIVPGVIATDKLTGGAGLAGVVPEMRILVAFLLIITAVMILTFTFVLEE